jgi:hypothetical protein
MGGLKFGFWPRKVDLDAGSTLIRVAADYDDALAATLGNSRVVDQWYYPPLTAEDIYQGVFWLGNTHTVETSVSCDGRRWSEFVVALIGLLDGLRLIPEGWVHFNRIAIKLNSHSDVTCRPVEIETILRIAELFWSGATDAIRRLIFGAVHWRIFSESYKQQFERFSGQYMTLDTCYRIHCEIHGKTKPEPNHAQRAEFLAAYYFMKTPSWAKTRVVGGKTECDLSNLRNEFFHEARYAGEPIGFKYPKFTVPIDLTLGSFNTRLILAILGVKSQYVRSPVETRSMFALDLEPTSASNADARREAGSDLNI